MVLDRFVVPANTAASVAAVSMSTLGCTTTSSVSNTDSFGFPISKSMDCARLRSPVVVVVEDFGGWGHDTAKRKTTVLRSVGTNSS